MKTKDSTRIRVLFLVAIMLTSLICQPIYAAYDNANYTIEEVKRINRETIAREQAERIRKKKLLILQERRRQLSRNKGHRVQTPSRQHHVPKQRYKARYVSQPSSSIPAWRRSASRTLTRSASDAIFAAAKTRNLSLLKELLAEGADVRHKNFNGETALHIAASLGNIQMVQYLLSQGANVNARTGKNWLPIHHAMRFQHPIVADYLIAHRASLWFKNSDGFSPLDFAARSKNQRIKSIAKRYGR